ncbi:MAG: hypothetical protein Q8R98_23715 [Rubrivivax sp.]|nr:hypothetical protein [Rubrivivax sp.]
MKPRFKLTAGNVIRATPDSINASLRVAGICQTDIARKLGVRFTSVNRVVQGGIRSHRIESALSKVLGMPMVVEPSKTPGALALVALRAKLERKGKTLESWAEERGYTRHDLVNIARADSKATRGKAHRLATDLGLKGQS